MSQKDIKLKSFEAILALEREARKDYILDNRDRIDEEYGRSGLSGLMSSLYDDLVYNNDFSGYRKMTDQKAKAKQRRYWHLNQSRIASAIDSSIYECGRFPDLYHLERDTQLTRTAIERHLENIEGHPSSFWEVQKAKMCLSSYMAYLLRLSYKGDLKAGALFLKYMEQWTNLSGRPLIEETKIGLSPQQEIILKLK